MIDWEEFRKNLKIQDNRMTQDPLYIVFERVKLSADPDYSDEWEYGDTEDGYSRIGDKREELLEFIKNNELEVKVTESMDGDEIMDAINEDYNHSIVKFYFQIVDKFVTCCFTEQGAQRYLDGNKHNLRDPHIYVTSLYRNREMLAIREMLMKGDR
jgi:hypothetical protein